MDLSVRDRLHTRLYRAPSRFTVPGSLPVLFFGDLPAARAATVGINPSQREYTDGQGQELVELQRRFETLQSLGAADRAALTPAQCDRAIATMRAYFRPGGPAYSWFAPLSRVLRGMGLDYATGEVAHLDLVQEATDPTWSTLVATDPTEAAALRAADAPFLRWQIDAFPLCLLVCNGRTVLDGVRRLTGAETVSEGRAARLTWQIAVANVGGRTLSIVGWNIPLLRPTGLTVAGQIALGEHLAARLHDLEGCQAKPAS